MTMLEKGIIESRNGKICVRYNMSDLLKAPPRYDAVEVGGGEFIGGTWILPKKNSQIEWPT